VNALAGGVSLIFFTLIFAVSVNAKDITGLFAAETDYDEQLRHACQSYCQGNRRKGILKRVLLERISDHSHSVRVNAILRNAHYQRLATGGGFNLFDYTVKIEGFGTLDDRTCNLRVDRIHIVDDRLGLASLAKQQTGKIYNIKDCGKFISMP